jgi:alkylation response protein AidB-like acyl-CoA dehydrogenase
MSSTTAPVTPPYLTALEPIVRDIVAPAAAEVDRDGLYPRAALDAMGRAGLLGLLSATDAGGMGEGHRGAALVVEELARHCASTAMVVLMHYAATPVVEAYGPIEARRRVAEGSCVLTLAFSETGSRSHFWVPLSTATAGANGSVELEADKSWVTSAGQADAYVWSSKPVAAEGLSSLWLVPTGLAGLEVGPPFEGLGLRGNESRPMRARGVSVPVESMLGLDGGGFDIMIAAVLPYFQVMSAAFSVGTADAATVKAGEHLVKTRLQHLDQALSQNPVNRAYVARMRVWTDQARALTLDTIDALETGREEAILRVLECKAAGSEAATQVTELAMRVCGGSAFRAGSGVERHFRDARASTVMAPTSDALYEFIGRVACGLPLFG